jgi:hypothetical protein
MLTFERIEGQWEGKGINISRAKVLGGWLVFIVHVIGVGTHSGVTFVPDPSHTWDGSSLPSMGSIEAGPNS